MPEKTPHLVLFDAHNSLYRAFHAIQVDMRSSAGESVSAVYGFTRMILKTLREMAPTHFVVCWDAKPTERLALDPEYKANRPPTPDLLRPQMDLAREFLKAWGVPSVEVQGCEADDLIAALARQAASQGYRVTIITTDKDMLQLTTDKIRVYLEHKKELVDAEGVKTRFGFYPDLLTDYFALMGDAVDNVPGIPGVGEKTAQKLVAEFGNVDQIFAAAQDSGTKIAPKIRKSILESRARLDLNKKLLGFPNTTCVTFEPDSMAVRPASEDLKEFLLRLGFASLVKEFEGGKEEKTEKKEETKLAYDPANLKVVYDLKEMLRVQPALISAIKGPILDLKLLAWVANPSEESFSLDWILSRYGGKSAEETAELLKKKLEEDGLWKIYEEMELPLTLILSEMEQTGISVDRNFLQDLRAQWAKEMENLRADIIQSSGADPEINLNSTKQLAFLLFEKLQLPHGKKNKTGYSTNEEVLQKLKPLHPVVGKILENREISKLQSTYVEGLLECINPSTERVHATFHQEGTQTGRLSCTNPNLQNIPIRSDRGLLIRKAFVPKQKDWMFLSLDYSQIDLRVFAHLSQDPDLIGFFKSGGDIHTETARALLGAGEGEVKPELRRAAKAVNFGILYGMGAHGLSEAIESSFEEAQAIIERYYARFPKVTQWREAQIEEARRTGAVRTLLGRVRYIENINSPRTHLREFSERAAVNTPVQGTSADIIKLAMIHMSQYLKLKALQSRMLVQVHDDILLEGPADEIQEHTKALIDLMASAIKLDVPLLVHAKSGSNWKEMNDLPA